jgi:hypothetical protein
MGTWKAYDASTLMQEPGTAHAVVVRPCRGNGRVLGEKQVPCLRQRSIPEQWRQRRTLRDLGLPVAFGPTVRVKVRVPL